MARSLFIESDRLALIERIKTVTPQSQRRWGKMDVRQMLEHLSYPMKSGMGELRAASKNKKMLQTAFMQNLFIYVLPWPKGKAPTSPEFDQVLNNRPGPEVGVGKEQLLATIGKFAALPDDFKFSDHPTFGKLSREKWGALQYRHIEHHLKQFGC